MKRSKYSKTGNIINILYRNTRRLISLPFRLIRLPFKLILGPVFNSNRLRIKQHRLYVNKRINSLAQQVNQNKTRYNLVMLHNSQISELESDISSVRKRIDIRETVSERLESDINFLSQKLKELITKNNHRVMTLNPDTVTAKLDKLKKDVNQLKQEDTDLGHIEAEALGMQVAKEEYDWKREQKLVHDKMADNK